MEQLNAKATNLLLKGLEHAKQHPEESRTMLGAAMTSLFGEVKYFQSDGKKVENTIRYIKSCTGWTMKELARSLSYGCKKEIDEEWAKEMIERGVEMRWREPRYKKPIHSKKSNITSSIKGYLLKVDYNDFNGNSVFAELGKPQYMCQHYGEKGIILKPEFGPLTTQLIEALDELNGKTTIRKDPNEAYKIAYASLANLSIHQLKKLKNDVDDHIYFLEAEQWKRDKEDREHLKALEQEYREREE